MNTFRRLWKQHNGRWIKLQTTTNGAFQISKPGTYKVNTKTGGWWGEPTIFTVTQEELDTATWVDDTGITRIGEYGSGIVI